MSQFLTILVIFSLMIAERHLDALERMYELHNVCVLCIDECLI